MSTRATARLGQLSSILTTSELAGDVTKGGLYKKKFRIAVIGSGNWGSTIAKIIAENTHENHEIFHSVVKMWVFDEKIDGVNLTEIINTKHENVKYLPGVRLPHNLHAEPDLIKAVHGADLIVFNLPHQFLTGVCAKLKGNIRPDTRALSCLKGLNVSKEGCKTLSSYISESLGIQCGALSGANLAPEVAHENWSETTIGYKIPSDFKGEGKDIDHHVLRAAFHRPYFHVKITDDVSGVSVAGALKNVVALAVGFVLGMGWGDNAKAGIMRVGLLEIMKFSTLFFPDSKPSTFTEESAGVADLITTCSGGRNVRVAIYMAETGVTAQEAEKELLNGQSSQGILTAKEVHELLAAVDKLDEFPLFEATYQIIYGGMPMENLPSLLSSD